ncbi:extracellular solute-binding protein [Caldicellulosiruptor changbaiensis]|uniref:Extracellular solute-binding protein n=1 Tax=Caldicellulosiruptor changbaiensis TaxID=1222016 RepID=A0A3T0D823_9FIRM|nr:extracellular solute-binding protein [Caldicellulosiruptor changbaiensis]AZT91287.1 extracellular solute-binding protein [Caldicellulosiruptor changbaiensis]
MRRVKLGNRISLLAIAIVFVFSSIFPSFVSSPSVAYAKSTTTLTYFVRLDPKVATSYNSYSQIAAYQLLQKKLGVKLVFKHPPVGGETDQFNLMVASRQLTDIIEWNWIDNYPGGPVKAMLDKIIIRLNDYIPKYAPNLNKYLQQHPDIKKLIVTDDGDIYGFPALRGTNPKIACVYYGPQIRADWLKKLGLKEPETVDDWYKVLKAFVTKDPNGNGKKDERGFSILRNASNPRYAFDYSSFLVGAWGIKTDFFQVNGRVKFGPLEPQFKEFVATLQKWWKEGLIDPDILTMNQKVIKANVQNDIIGSWIGLLSGDMGFFLNLKKDVIATKFPVLKKGDYPLLGQAESLFSRTSAAITTACKDIPTAMKVLDWGYSKEGFAAFNYGVEGKSYVVKNGKVYYTDEILKNPKGLSAAEALAKYARASISGPFAQADEYYYQIQMMYPQQKEAVEKWGQVKNDRVLPPLSFTDDESKRLANIMNTVNTYYDEMFLKLMTGKSTNVDAFVKTLKRMNIDQAIKIYQAAYERYKKRK